MRTVLHLTGMISTKYGSMERYLLETVRQCSLKGYGSVLQYEAIPASHEYLAALKSAGAEVIAMPTAARSASNAVRLARLVGRVRPYSINSHFWEWTEYLSRLWPAASSEPPPRSLWCIMSSISPVVPAPGMRTTGATMSSPYPMRS